MGKYKENRINKLQNRIWEIDFIRGVLILGMLIDHFMFWLGFFATLFTPEQIPGWLNGIAQFADAYWKNDIKIAIRLIGVSLFFFLTGIASKFSKSNLKRSLICIGFSLLLSFAYLLYTFITKNRYIALFSIITCLGVSMLLYWVGKTIYDKASKGGNNWKWWSLGIGCTLVLAGFIMNLCVSTDLRFGTIFLSMFGQYNPGNFNSDESLTFGKAILTIIGSYKWGNDWLGLLPYLGFTFLGGFFGEHFYSNKLSLFHRSSIEENKEFNIKATRKTWFINWCGSKTFIIYIFHPAIIILIVFSFYMISTGVWPF